ncbi:hypothetical protein KR038_000819 [Drosophila bunnanda]|nr:hypothetical protein KR038_000819 [Drosophila bunnanda]
MRRLLVVFLWPLLLSTLIWLVILEELIFYNSNACDKLNEFFFEPYKEEIHDFQVGFRSHRWNDDRIARLLRQQVRVHCLVYLDESDYNRGPGKLDHIRSTWGRRCNRLTTIHLWEIPITEAYRQIYRDFRHELEWLLVVYLDSFVIVENLRLLLASYPPNRAIYFSAHHSMLAYAHVGRVPSTDYIFSREALEQLCTRDCLHDDFSLKECLGRMQHGHSDALFDFNVPAVLIPFTLREAFWLWPCAFQSVYGNQSWSSCFGQAVLLPYVTAVQMEILEFVLYHLRPYGYVNRLSELKSLNIAPRPTNTVVARRMFRSVRILCLVLTWPKGYMHGVKSISETWGRHCNRVLYYSQSRLSGVEGAETVALNVSDERNMLWGKTKAAFRHAYRHYRHEADWFYKADDDTYAIMENMRLMLRPYSPDTPIYFGSTFNLDSQIYMSGGAGYVLSRKAVELFVDATGEKSLCQPGPRGVEDFEMGRCMDTLNVKIGDSTDLYGRHRFFSLPLQYFLTSQENDEFWLSKYLVHTCKTGIQCCSTYSISVHNVSPNEMHFLEAVLYEGRPYGLIAGHPPSKSSQKKGDGVLMYTDYIS